MDETSSYASKARTEMVHRVLEGLRDEAFELAKDIGVESLTAPGGLRSFVEKMREVVFPRATEEARELFRVTTGKTIAIWDLRLLLRTKLMVPSTPTWGAIKRLLIIS